MYFLRKKLGFIDRVMMPMMLAQQT